MHLLYLANSRLPTEKAHGAQIIKTCEALARAGIRVTLVVPRRLNPLREEVFAYYAAEPLFKMVRLPTLDVVRFGALGFLVQSATFALASFAYVTFHSGQVYSRDESMLWLPSLVGRSYIWESHTGAWNAVAKRVATHASAVVVISQGLKDFYMGHDIRNIIVAHDGVDLAPFTNAKSKTEARTELGLPLDAKIALYVGRVDGWKGTDTLYAAATELAEECRVVIVGGEAEQVRTLSERYPQVTFLGSRPYRQIADIEAAADVLVLPNSAAPEISARFTSPMKLFTYMASGVPMVVSDLPSLREILSEETATFAVPDDAPAFARSIREVLQRPADAAAKAERARALVAGYTWDARARRIMEALTA